MADDTKSGPDDIVPDNDNQGLEDGPEREAWQRVDRVALTLARIIGRKISRRSSSQTTTDPSDETADEADKDKEAVHDPRCALRPLFLRKPMC